MQREWRFQASFPQAYNILATNYVFESANLALRDMAACTSGARRFIVTDENVYRFYGKQLIDYFKMHDVEIRVHIMQHGEEHKSLDSVVAIIQALDDFGIRRYSDPIIALGGGVVTDTVGLAAHLYRRGTPYVRIPTTLVGLVDAGIGVKVGVNFGKRKNALGSFYGPLGSIIDSTFLATLPVRHRSNGIAEVIKLAVACDHDLFDLLEAQLKRGLRYGIDEHLISKALTVMLAQLQTNPWEHDLRRAVDFGHTFSPRLEMDSDGRLLHGESVALDMTLCCGIAVGRGLLDSEAASRVMDALTAAGLPQYDELCAKARLWAGLNDAIRHRDGAQHLFLPTSIGRGLFVEDISRTDIDKAISWASQL